MIKWGDPDIRESKNSPYYVGGYWSQEGTAPDRYSKQIPIKELYKHIYLDPAYSLPLFKLRIGDHNPSLRMVKFENQRYGR
ncbi:glycoside hydrolase [Peribacillus simplex]|uniref:glycoside hydrolase n=1 Tax=Peribacillus simplex TaxID=1478 RepID=UPI00398A6B72